MEIKHTPGPWEIRYLSGIDMDIIPKNGHTICHLNGYSHSVELMDENEEEERANAKLIAAAPDLLKALLDLRDILHNHYGDDRDETPIIDQAFEAIKKATE